MSTAQTPTTTIRIPPDLRRALRIRAAENERSLTHEIIERLEKSLLTESGKEGA